MEESSESIFNTWWGSGGRRVIPREDYMNPFHSLSRVAVVLGATLLVVGCASTPDSRIKKNQETFNTYSVEIQSNIRVGKVGLGYDEEMVRMALGKPNEKSTAVDEDGETVSWGYTKSSPGFSIGVGGGSYGGSSGMGGGVGMGSGSKSKYTAIIEFRAGKVTSARYFEN